MADVGAGRGEERFGVLDARDRLEARRGLRVVVRGQAVDLLDVEDGVALQERDLALDLLAGRRVGFGARDLVGVDDKRALLALADMRRRARAPA